MNETMIASVIKALRNSPTVLPNTRCVLMHFMRTGANDVLKLVKLIAAIMRITQPMVKSRNTVARFALG